MSDVNSERLEKLLIYIKITEFNITDSLIESHNTITCSNKFNLRKVNFKPYGYDKVYRDKELIEDKVYQKIEQFNKRKITIARRYTFISKSEWENLSDILC